MMLEAVNVSKFYGSSQALDGVSFSAEKGETVGILGNSGSGKSTVMRIVSGYLAPTNGKVTVCGADPRIPATRQCIGYLPEGTPLPPLMRVREYLCFRAELKGIFGRKELDKAIAAVQDFCPLKAVDDTLISRLAPNDRQWVGIAEALLGGPKVLLFDELTAGMDARQAGEARGLIASLKGRATILVSSRVLGDLERSCNRVVIFQRGRVMTDGSLESIYREYVEERTVVLKIIAHEPVREAFRAVPGVRTVTVTPNPENETEMTVGVTIPSGVDLRQELSQVCARRGWLVTGMQVEPVRLEDLFRKFPVGQW